MKMLPLTAEESERARWHLRSYGFCRELHDGLITEEQIREEIAKCPEQYREEFRAGLNLYRRRFKEYREWRKKNGVGTSTALGGTLR